MQSLSAETMNADDYARRLFLSLPPNAQQYYKEKSKIPLAEIVHKPSLFENIYRG